jgi:predicted dehydrogenase
MADATLKIGIIGTGGISRRHIQGYRDNPRAEILALCGINREEAEKLAREYHIPQVYTDRERFLADSGIDAVSICTWNCDHAVSSIAAMKSGKHVLCEKPMALNSSQAKEMLRVSQSTGRVLMIGFARRFGRDCAVMKDLIREGLLGDVYYAKACNLRRNGFPGGWFGDSRYAGGGPLIDLGVHAIDLVRYVTGCPAAVSVFGITGDAIKDRPGLKEERTGYQSAGISKDFVFDVEDFAAAMIRFDNGMTLSVETAFSLNIERDKEQLELFGSKAGLRLAPELAMAGEQNGYLSDTLFPAVSQYSIEELFAGEIGNFIDCILDKVPCKAPAEDGVALMEILDAVYQSAKTGHEIVLKKVDRS